MIPNIIDKKQEKAFLSNLEGSLIETYYSDPKIIKELCQEKPVHEAMLNYVVAGNFGKDDTRNLFTKFQQELSEAAKRRARTESRKRVNDSTRLKAV